MQHLHIMLRCLVWAQQPFTVEGVRKRDYDCKIALTLNGVWEKAGLEPQGTRARKKTCPWTRSCNNYPSIRPPLITSQLLRSPYPKFNPSSLCLFLRPEAWPIPRLLDAHIIVSFGPDSNKKTNLVTGCKSTFHYVVLANRS